MKQWVRGVQKRDSSLLFLAFVLTEFLDFELRGHGLVSVRDHEDQPMLRHQHFLERKCAEFRGQVSDLGCGCSAPPIRDGHGVPHPLWFMGVGGHHGGFENHQTSLLVSENFLDFSTGGGYRLQVSSDFRERYLQRCALAEVNSFHVPFSGVGVLERNS